MRQDFHQSTAEQVLQTHQLVREICHLANRNYSAMKVENVMRKIC